MADELNQIGISRLSMPQHGHIGAAASTALPSSVGSWPPTPIAVESEMPFENTSGTDGPIPPEIAQLKWSWGASGVGWIWLSRHGMQGYAALVFFAGLGLRFDTSSLSPFIAVPLSLAIPIVLGIKGPQLAWRKRRYDSIEHYFATERAWAKWGIALISFSGLMILAAVILPLIAAARLYHPH